MTDLEKVDRQHYWHPFTQMAEYEPLIIQRAEGVWLYDLEGRRLLDGAASMWCNVLGHRNPAIDQAIKQQLDNVAHVTSLGMSNPTTIELTAKLVELSPPGLECVFYSSDGASSVEVALKMAFQYWRQIESPQPQRTLYLAVGNAYHGDSLGAVSVGGVARFHAMFEPLLFDVVRGPCPDCYRYPDGLPEQQLNDYYLAEYRSLMQQYGDRLAAVIVEPLVQGAAGMIQHPPGFLRGLADLVRQHGSLLIVDEIATGMGRTGKLWACQWEEVQPDFLVCGKGLSGGYLPISATLATRQIWNAFLGPYSQSRSFFHGHTFAGNPLASAAALATIKEIVDQQICSQVQVHSDYMRSRLESLSDHPYVGDIRIQGLMAGVELVQSRRTKVGFPWQEKIGHAICQRMLQYGVWTRPLGNVIVLMPPLCIQPPEIDLLVDALTHAIEQQFS